MSKAPQTWSEHSSEWSISVMTKLARLDGGVGDLHLDGVTLIQGIPFLPYSSIGIGPSSSRGFYEVKSPRMGPCLNSDLVCISPLG